MLKLQCPSIASGGGANFHHDHCTAKACTWWNTRCTAVDTVPRGRLTRRLKCPLAGQCRWAKQAADGVCPPMTHGTLCEHQGGTFNTFDYEEG